MKPAVRSSSSGKRASWTRISVSADEHVRRGLQQRHWLRLHAALTGLLALLLMLAISAGLLQAGMRSMGWRYGLALAGGYVLYLLLVRLWAGCMLRRDWNADASGGDGGSGGSSAGGSTRGPADVIHSGEGGSFGGGGSSGDWSAAAVDASGADASGAAAPGAESASSGIDWGGGLDAIDGEGVVVLPVLALFALMLLAFTGLGSLLWLVWGSELFLAVAVEVAFALLMARSLYVMERDGWLLVALRLSWKPMLGALLSAVALGLLCDALFPEADTLAQVIKSLRGR